MTPRPRPAERAARAARPASPRDRLLATARDLFTRRGFDGVSVRELTARARVNLGAITYYFGSKEGLYNAALESMARPFADRVAEAARSGGTALDRVEAVVRVVLSHLAEHAEVPKWLLRELALERPLPPPMLELMRRNAGTLAAVISDGQREGTVREGDPRLLALSVMAQPFYFKIAGRGFEQAFGIRPGDPELWTRLVEHVVESVRRTIAYTPKVIT
jgi:AcrR family transcriptional regulator